MQQIEFKSEYMIINKRAVFFFRLEPINIFSLTSEEQDRYYEKVKRTFDIMNDLDIQISIKTRRMYPSDIGSHLNKFIGNAKAKRYCNELNDYILTHYIPFKLFYLSVSVSIDETLSEEKLDLIKLKIDLITSYLEAIGIKLFQMKDMEMKQIILDYL